MNLREIDRWEPSSWDWIPTTLLLQRVGERIRELELVPATKLFETVAVYSTPNLLAAFQELRTFGDRVCLILPSADKFTSETNGSELRVEAEREFELILCDRDAGERQYALIGEPNLQGNTDDTTMTPGVLRVKDYLTNHLLGAHLGLQPRQVKLRPVSGQAFRIAETDRGNEWGRAGWQMTWCAYAGMTGRRIR